MDNSDRGFFGEGDDEIVYSESTIDSPPREPGQTEMFPKTNPLTEEKSNERRFEVQLALSIRPVGGEPIKIPVIKDILSGTIVRQALNLALNSRRVSTIIDAVLDNPKHEDAEESSDLPAVLSEPAPVETSPEPVKPKGESKPFKARAFDEDLAPVREMTLEEAAAEIF